MRARARALLRRLGITGKAVLLCGLLTGGSLALVVGYAWKGSHDAIRSQLRATQAARIQAWQARHAEALGSRDAWKLAEAVGEVARDPYVIFAAIYDREGRLLTRTGDEEAYLQPHTLDILVPLGARLPGVPDPAAGTPPLPGLVPDPADAARSIAFKDRFRAVFESRGAWSEDLQGWVGVTLTTAPLDRIASTVLRPLLLMALASVAAACFVGWLVARRVSQPIRMMGESLASMEQGRFDLPFHEIPRPADEVGDLATRMSVLATRLSKGSPANPAGGRAAGSPAGDMGAEGSGGS